MAAAGRLYADAAAKYETPFWLRRSTRGREGHEATDRQWPTEHTPDTLVRVHPRVIFKQVRVIEESFVASATAVVRPDFREPVVFLDGVRVAPLIKMLNGRVRCDEVVRCWTLLVPPRKALQLLIAALKLGILCPDND